MKNLFAAPPLISAVLLMAASPAVAQEPELPISTGDITVGYIDNAVPGNIVRFRFDSGYGVDKANRAEFLWAWPMPVGPGPATKESNVDYQTVSAYLECATASNFSLFIDLPVTATNPEINANTAGLSDIQAGFKWVMAEGEDEVVTFQLAGWLPTGDESRGLGTGHSTIEPGLLYHRRVTEQWSVDAELRHWIPIDGTDKRAGTVWRYGLGVSYNSLCVGCRRVRPVVEMVGWTVVDGLSQFVRFPGGPVVVEDARGDTIVNLKLGARVDVGCHGDLYMGYGRAITGPQWYNDILRVEWRRQF